MNEFFLIIILVLLGLYLVSLYNRLVRLRQTCQQGLGDIDVQLRQRHDLVPNLVTTVKGYAAHEVEALDAVIEARNRTAAAAGAISDAAQAELGRSVDRLLALAESYPDLKASANFVELQSELADIEDKLAAARRAYNSAVAQFNAVRESFPAIIFAPLLGFKVAEFHALQDHEKAMTAVPQVKL